MGTVGLTSLSLLYPLSFVISLILTLVYRL
jgi:hypothetical protein